AWSQGVQPAKHGECRPPAHRPGGEGRACRRRACARVPSYRSAPSGGAVDPPRKIALAISVRCFILWNCCVASNPFMSRTSLFATSPDRLAPVAESSVTIQVLQRAMMLLDVLAKHSDPVPLKDLAAATGLHTSTT